MGQPATRINDMLHRVTFATAWESPRSQILGRLVSAGLLLPGLEADSAPVAAVPQTPQITPDGGVASGLPLVPVGLRAAGLLAVELCAPVGAKLVELRGRIRGGGFAGLFRSYLLQTVPIEDIGSRQICKSLDFCIGEAG